MAKKIKLSKKFIFSHWPKISIGLNKSNNQSTNRSLHWLYQLKTNKLHNQSKSDLK